MSRPDGGPAFPQPDVSSANPAERPWGMTLRDYFAAKALAGLLKVNAPHEIGQMRETYAAEAYLIADAMLAERSKP